MFMHVEWDPTKAKSNLKKHGVDFADAAIALEDPNALTIEDGGHHELRFKTLGMGPNLKSFVVMSTNEEPFVSSPLEGYRGETAHTIKDSYE